MMLIYINLLVVLTATLTFAAISIPSKENSNLNGRIVGGYEASIQQFPHQASLQRNGKHICGAAIILAQFLLTAAHCVDQKTPNAYMVRIGSSSPYQGGLLIPVKQIVSHELYNVPTLINNDIAIIQLAQEIKFNRNIRSIPLLTNARELTSNIWLFVSGWGATSAEDHRVTPRLRYTFLKEKNLIRCASTYSDMTKVTSTMICAAAENGGRDSCQGDSGGPLITLIKGSMKLAGIVSWGVGCAHPDYPGVYTRVDSYIEWITNKVKEMSSNQ